MIPTRSASPTRRSSLLQDDPHAAVTPRSAARFRETPPQPADEALFAALREWRRRAADGKPAFTVAHDRTLTAITNARPDSLNSLGQIRGVGPAFIERYGADILALIATSAAGAPDP